MSEGMTAGDLVRKNWYLIVILAVCVAGTVFFALQEEEPVVTGEDTQMMMAAQARANGAPSGVDQLQRSGPPPEQQTRDIIASHEKVIEENPESEDVPAYLAAIGNLYRLRLKDYEKAASYYERVLTEHPDSDSTRGAFIQLVACYERLGDVEAAKRTYRRMMDAFPPDTQEHEYARLKLHGEIAPLEQ